MNWTTFNTENIKSKYLFKFLSETNLNKFLSTGNIWFSRADKFGDKIIEKTGDNLNLQIDKSSDKKIKFSLLTERGYSRSGFCNCC